MGATVVRGVNRRWSALLLVIGAVVINLPVAHSGYYGWRLDGDGVETSAVVTDTQELPPEDDPTYAVEFRFDSDIDPEQRKWFASVDEETYQEAESTDRIDVRVLPDHPSTYEAAGQEKTRMGLVLTALGDLMLILIALVLWKAPPRIEELHLVAAGDVEVGRRKPGLQRIHGDLYEVYGEVTGIEDDHVVLDIGNRQSVRVRLNGHKNRVGYEQPARVVGTPPGTPAPDTLGG